MVVVRAAMLVYGMGWLMVVAKACELVASKVVRLVVY